MREWDHMWVSVLCHTVSCCVRVPVRITSWLQLINDTIVDFQPAAVFVWNSDIPKFVVSSILASFDKDSYLWCYVEMLKVPSPSAFYSFLHLPAFRKLEGFCQMSWWWWSCVSESPWSRYNMACVATLECVFSLTSQWHCFHSPTSTRPSHPFCSSQFSSRALYHSSLLCDYWWIPTIVIQLLGKK